MNETETGKKDLTKTGKVEEQAEKTEVKKAVKVKKQAEHVEAKKASKGKEKKRSRKNRPQKLISFASFWENMKFTDGDEITTYKTSLSKETNKLIISQGSSLNPKFARYEIRINPDNVLKALQQIEEITKDWKQSYDKKGEIDSTWRIVLNYKNGKKKIIHGFSNAYPENGYELGKQLWLILEYELDYRIF